MLTLAAGTAALAQGRYDNGQPNQGYNQNGPGPGGPGSGDPRDDGPRGGHGRSRAIVYVEDKFGGRSQVIDRPTPSMRQFDMNDKISSIEVHGGAWLVCEDDDFRGRCVTVDHSIRKLSDIGMDDRISSMRPIRGGY
ncbi:MAG: beta/gamma crystallin-related protein [Janthinobacterium lividum]